MLALGGLVAAPRAPRRRSLGRRSPATCILPARCACSGARCGGAASSSDGRRCVMPAFGAYAGGLNVLDAAFAPLFGGRLSPRTSSAQPRLRQFRLAQLCRLKPRAFAPQASNGSKASATIRMTDHERREHGAQLAVPARRDAAIDSETSETPSTRKQRDQRSTSSCGCGMNSATMPPAARHRQTNRLLRCLATGSPSPTPHRIRPGRMR